MAEYQSGRYDVVRYPNCYAVVDKQDPNHRHVKQFPFSVGGRESARIEVPSAQPSCVAFGGARLGTLYITSARVGLNDRALQGDLRAGGVFIATPAARGVAEPVFSGRT